MAIWDTKETISLNCPTCGDALRFDSAIKASVCRSCGNVYEPGTLNVTGKLKFVDVDNASEKEENKREYVCGSCGATVVTDENTAATFCAFCGSPSIMGRRLAKEFRPDYIIPFTVKREEAVQKFKDWAKKHKNAPRDLMSAKTINKITGLYVPFWLINADCYSKVSGLGYVQENPTERSVFNFTRKMMFKVKNVPFDGSFKISNFLMHSIEPFDFSDLCEFDDIYLPGCYAERYDRNALDLTEVIDIRISKFAQQAADILVKSNMSESGVKYTSVDADSSESYIKNLSQKYALLPVWFLNYDYHGESYQIAINGQTGKVSGELPISRINNFANILKQCAPLIAGVVASVFLAGVAMFAACGTLYHRDQLAEWVALGFLLIAFILGPLLIHKFHNVQLENLNSLEKEPDVSEYFDYSVAPKLLSSTDNVVGFQVRVPDVGADGRTRGSNWMYIDDAKSMMF